MNKRANRFAPEVRERAVRLVQEHWAAPVTLGYVPSIVPKIVCTAETLQE